MTSTIEQHLSTSTFPDSIHPLSGDCASVAKALVSEFGGEFVCLYGTKNNSGNELPAHVLVEIDGLLYDGSGSLTYQEAFEIHLVLNGELTAEDFSDDYFIQESPPSYMVNEQKVEIIKSAL